MAAFVCFYSSSWVRYLLKEDKSTLIWFGAAFRADGGDVRVQLGTHAPGGQGAVSIDGCASLGLVSIPNRQNRNSEASCEWRYCEVGGFCTCTLFSKMQSSTAPKWWRLISPMPPNLVNAVRGAVCDVCEDPGGNWQESFELSRNHVTFVIGRSADRGGFADDRPTFFPRFCSY